MNTTEWPIWLQIAFVTGAVMAAGIVWLIWAAVQESARAAQYPLPQPLDRQSETPDPTHDRVEGL